jgi:hypothetical protein
MKKMTWPHVRLACSLAVALVVPFWRPWGVPNGFAGLTAGMAVPVSNSRIKIQQSERMDLFCFVLFEETSHH